MIMVSYYNLITEKMTKVTPPKSHTSEAPALWLTVMSHLKPAFMQITEHKAWTIWCIYAVKVAD